MLTSLYFSKQLESKLKISMDSIFQIKINENKLQKILNDLCKEQSRLGHEMKEAFERINVNQGNNQNIRKQLKQKIDDIYSSIQENEKKIYEKIQINSVQMHKSISQISQLMSRKLYDHELQVTEIRKELSQKQNQFEKKIDKIDKSIVQLQANISQNLETKQKLDKFENILGKNSQVISLLKNKNFIYFLQTLVDKQTGSKAIEPFKYNRNPFYHETNDQKLKRYKQIKKSLVETQNRIDNMQSEYIGLFHTTSQSSKQNKQQTHLHYAFLSTKIKDLQSKIIENQCTLTPGNTQKILYPSDSRQRSKCTTKHSIGFENPIISKGNIIIKNKQHSFEGLFEQMQKIKINVEENKKDFSLKIQKIQDSLWCQTNKTESLKQKFAVLKNQLKQINDKIKIFNHHNQFSSDKQFLNPKSIGEFMNQFRNIQDNLEDKLKQKMQIGTYNKSSQLILEKIKIINQQMDSKANIDETRKAFCFIQQKIKQIVTLIADLQNSNKKTAARKMVIQCLSCDDNFFEENQSPPVQNIQILTSRVHTPRMASHFNPLNKEKQRLNRHQFRKSNIQL